MKIVICGAGIAGLTLANRIAALGGEVVLVERSPGPRPQGYMIDFFGQGLDAIRAMGLLEALAGTAYDIHEAELLDERGRRRAGVQAAQFAGGQLLNVMRPDLERVLRESLPPQVDLRFGTTVTDVVDDGDGVRVVLDDGSDVTADLLVGADGVHSTVRQLVFGPEERFFRYLGFHTSAFEFEAPALHATVRERFCLTDTVGRQMGFYALRDGRVAAFGVHRTPTTERPSDIHDAMRSTYSGLGWVVPDALAQLPPSSAIYYDQVAQIVMPRWSSGRVVLIGDACAAVSLLAGQGASLGIAGAYLLADQLDRAPSIAHALDEYERLWRPLVEEKQRVGRAGARWFLPATAWELRLRRTALRAMRLPGLNRLAASLVTGKSSAMITNLRAAGSTTGRLGAAAH